MLTTIYKMSHIFKNIKPFQNELSETYLVIYINIRSSSIFGRVSYNAFIVHDE